MSRSILPIGLSLLLLAGCGSATSGDGLQSSEQFGTVTISAGDGSMMTASAIRDFNVREYTVNGSAEDVWSALPGALETFGLEPNRIDSDRRLIGVDNVRIRRIEGGRPSRYLSCGRTATGLAADSYDVYLTLIAQVLEEGSLVSLQLQAFASASNPALSGSRVDCDTNGRLEGRFAAIVAARLE